MAQSIEMARERWFEADFEASREAFAQVLGSADASPMEILDAHRYLAALYLLLGDEESARRHADAAIALDSGVDPPDGSPPAVMDLFRMARRRAERREAYVVLSTSMPPALSEPTLVIASLRSSPPGLVGQLRLRCGERESEGPPPELRLEVVPEGRLACSAEATTPAGAVLFGTQEDFQVEGISRRTFPWIIAGVAVGAAVVLTVVAVAVAKRPGDAQITGTTVVGW